MTPSAAGVAVTYTGKEDPFIERNYGSGLSFERGQTRRVPVDLSAKLLRHVDIFEPAAALPVKVDMQEPEKAVDSAAEPQDDTQQQLDEGKRLQSEQAAASNMRQDVVDQINLMDKDALKDYAHTKYGQPIPKTLSVENMRAKVVGFIDQYGLV